MRKVLKDAGRERGTQVPDLIVTGQAGYRLLTADDAVDAHQFGKLVTRGSSALSAGDNGTAAEALRHALDMWNGDALSNVCAGRVLTPRVVALAETRTRAHELRIEADLRLGRHREIIAELRSLVAAHPLNEWLRARLADALSRVGRRHEALTVLSEARALLDRELGLRPSEELRQLEQEIIADRRAGALGTA